MDKFHSLWEDYQREHKMLHRDDDFYVKVPEGEVFNEEVVYNYED